jgi:hypothetical protein
LAISSVKAFLVASWAAIAATAKKDNGANGRKEITCFLLSFGSRVPETVFHSRTNPDWTAVTMRRLRNTESELARPASPCTQQMPAAITTFQLKMFYHLNSAEPRVG